MNRAVINLKFTAEDVKKRRDICSNCESKKNNKVFDYCGECKCVITFKTRVPNTKCPKGKW